MVRAPHPSGTGAGGNVDRAASAFVRFENVSLLDEVRSVGADNFEPDDDFEEGGAGETLDVETHPTVVKPPYLLRQVSFDICSGESCVIDSADLHQARRMLDLIAGACRPTSGKVVTAGTVVALHKLRLFMASDNNQLSIQDRLQLCFSLSGWRRVEITRAMESAARTLKVPRSMLRRNLGSISKAAFRTIAVEIAGELGPDIVLADRELMKVIGASRWDKLVADCAAAQRILIVAGGSGQSAEGPFARRLFLEGDGSARTIDMNDEEKIDDAHDDAGWLVEVDIDSTSGTLDASIFCQSTKGGEIDTIRVTLSGSSYKTSTVFSRPSGKLQPNEAERFHILLPGVIKQKCRMSVMLVGWGGGEPLAVLREYKILPASEGEVRARATSEVKIIHLASHQGQDPWDTFA